MLRARRCMNVLLLIVFAGASAAAMAPGETMDVNEAMGNNVVVNGAVAMYGNEPHTFLGLLADPADNRDISGRRGVSIRLTGETLFRLVFREDATGAELRALLKTLQGSPVRVEGTLTAPAKGPGFPAVIQVDSVEPGR